MEKEQSKVVELYRGELWECQLLESIHSFRTNGAGND